VVLLDIPGGKPDEQDDAASPIGYLFMQLEASQQTETKHTCATAHERMKRPTVDFYKQTNLFTDAEFPTNDALYWADMFSETLGITASLQERVTWIRAS